MADRKDIARKIAQRLLKERMIILPPFETVETKWKLENIIYEELVDNE